MGREVRRVKSDWDHPKENDKYVPLMDGYEHDKEEFEAMYQKQGLQETLDWYGQAPDINNYIPDWPDSERTHIQMYEDTSEGTPISPVMESAEELARWLADNNASSFGSSGATYDQWLGMIKAGWAPSMVISGGEIKSGVAALNRL